MRCVFFILLGLSYLTQAQENKIVPSQESVVKIRSPHKATMYSALLPGLGQIYNKKYWKLPILYAGIGVTVYAINWNNKQFNTHKSAFKDFTVFKDWKYQNPELPKPTNDSYKEILNVDFEETSSYFDDWFQTQLKNRKDSYKHDRDLSYIILAGIYVLNIIDAAVDAHFFNFNVSEDLSVRMEPVVNYTAYSNNTIGLKCNINF